MCGGSVKAGQTTGSGGEPAQDKKTPRGVRKGITPAALAAQGRWDDVSGRRRTHFCGAYWGWGFHEDGCRSGVAAAASLGVTW